MNILLVEDNTLDAGLVADAFARHAPAAHLRHVTTLAEARACLAGARTGGPVWNALIVDLRLPDGSGIELLHEVRAKSLPLAVLVLTGSGDEEKAAAVLRAGANDYIIKRPETLAEMPALALAAIERFRAEPSTGGPQALRVLYAEHNPADSDLTRRYLERNAPHIHMQAVDSGAAVLEELAGVPEGGPPPWDILLLDHRLRDMNSLEILESIRRQRKLDLPVVIVTGQGDEEVVSKAMRLGVSDYLVKRPGYLYEMATSLDEAHRRHQMAREQVVLKESEARLRELTERLNHYLTTSPTITYALRVGEGWVESIWVSENIQRILGWTAQEALEPGWWRANVAPEDLPGVEDAMGRLLTEPGLETVTHEYQFLRKDGARVWIRDELRLQRSADGVHGEIVGTWVDVTEQKRTEQSARLQSAALAVAANAIYITNHLGQIEWVNPAFTKLTGFSAEAAAGRGPTALLGTAEEPGHNWNMMWHDVLGGQVWTGEARHVRRDGKCLVVEETITPVRDERGRITHCISIMQDVTEKKELQHQLLRTQRLESVGRLASGIAHDLNNVLAPMLMAPAVIRSVVKEPLVHSLVDSIEQNARRGAEIIRQLLTFGRGVEGQRAPVEPAAILVEMEKIVRQTFPKNIQCSLSLPAEPWAVMGDETQIHQVVMNLCVNARDAMPRGGDLHLALENVTLDETSAAMRPGAHAGNYVCLLVKDSGTGISQADLEHIFDPFFTTKELGAGTGLGLSTVLGIVKGHGGFIEVRTKGGEGSTFLVYLPASGRGPRGPALGGPSAFPRGQGQTILVVDDELSVRQVARTILEMHGYTVLEAEDGVQGISLFASHMDRIHAVVTDMMMPFMEGAPFIRSLRRLNPKLPIIAISGQQSPTQTFPEGSEKPDEFLSKPFAAGDLLHALQRVLNAPKT